MKTAATPHHPTPEERVAYLYGELPGTQRTALSDHLTGCPECRAANAELSRTLSLLDEWRLPGLPGRRRDWRGALKWAVAAVLFAGLGLAAGRLGSPRFDRAELRAALADELRQEFTAETARMLTVTLSSFEESTDRKIADLAAGWAQLRERDRQSLVGLLLAAEDQRQAELAWIRRDLETVAVTTDQSLLAASRRLGQLANLTPTPPGPSRADAPYPSSPNESVPQ